MTLLAMTKNVIKNLVRGPVTERYPFVEKKYFSGTRGKVDIEIEKCIFCGICQRKCPTAALAVTKDPKTWTVDRLRCVFCNACVEACPKKCLSLDVKGVAASAGQNKETFRA